MIFRTLAFAAVTLGLGTTALAKDLNLTSKGLKNGATFAEKNVANTFGCKGGDESPELSWSAGPADTKGYALTVFDPDAPTGSGWWHWVVFNIPPTVTKLEAGAGSADGAKLPAGAIQSRTDSGKPGYMGPCPPPGDKPHRYVFRVVALKDKIALDKDAMPAVVGFYTNQLKLAEGKFFALYGR